MGSLQNSILTVINGGRSSANLCRDPKRFTIDAVRGRACAVARPLFSFRGQVHPFSRFLLILSPRSLLLYADRAEPDLFSSHKTGKQQLNFLAALPVIITILFQWPLRVGVGVGARYYPGGDEAQGAGTPRHCKQVAEESSSVLVSRTRGPKNCLNGVGRVVLSPPVIN